MPAVALSGVIVLNTIYRGNEIILLDRAIYRRKPFLSFLTMALSMAQRTPVLTAEACMYGLSSAVKRRERATLFDG
jgi:hypothetical protein